MFGSLGVLFCSVLLQPGICPWRIIRALTGRSCSWIPPVLIMYAKTMERPLSNTQRPRDENHLLWGQELQLDSLLRAERKGFQPIDEPISYGEKLESQFFFFLQFSQSFKSNSEFWKNIAVLNLDAEVVVAKNKGSCLFIPSPRMNLLHRGVYGDV